MLNLHDGLTRHSNINCSISVAQNVKEEKKQRF
jgi:hypothetical protein